MTRTIASGRLETAALMIHAPAHGERSTRTVLFGATTASRVRPSHCIEPSSVCGIHFERAAVPVRAVVPHGAFVRSRTRLRSVAQGADRGEGSIAAIVGSRGVSVHRIDNTPSRT